MADDKPQASVPSSRRWQGSGSAGGQRGSTSKLGKIFGILAVMIVLLGVVALLARLWNTFQEPYFLSIPVSQYSHYYPPNAFVERDSERLRARFSNSSQEAFRSQEKARL